MKANKKNGTIRQKDIFTFACLAAMCLVLLGTHGRAQAGCDEDFPCTFEIEEHQLQEVPTVFKFQSRISQAKIPVGDATFPMLIVNLRRGEDQLCQEEFADVRVRDSVLNLEIGRNMDCALDQVIAQNNSLYFQICIGSPENCLKPIALASVPYAVKSTFASQAQEAYRSDVSGQCNYAHRTTADRDMFITDDYGTGYFDFYSHDEASLAYLFESMSVPPEYVGDGYIQWVPVGGAGDARLHICAKEIDFDDPKPLAQLVLHAAVTRLMGSALIELALTVAGEATFENNVAFSGQTAEFGVIPNDSSVTFNSSVHFLGDVTIDEPISGILADNSVESAHVVNGSLTSDDLGTNSVTASEIANNAVGTSEVINDSLTSDDLGQDSVGSDEIAEGAVGTSEVENDSLTADDLHSDSVGSDEIAEGAVGTSEVEDDSLTADDIADRSITRFDIALNSLTAGEIAPNAIGKSELAPDSVGRSELRDGAVTNDKIFIATNKYSATNSSGETTTNMGNRHFCALTKIRLYNTDGYCRVDNSLIYWTVTAYNASCSAWCF